MLRTKYFLYLVLISSCFVLLFSLFHYLKPSCGEAQEGMGCYAPESAQLQHYWDYATCNRHCRKTTELITADRKFAFCYLRGAGFENTDDDETSECTVFLDPKDNMWKVTARTTKVDDNGARCYAHCIYLN